MRLIRVTQTLKNARIQRNTFFYAKDTGLLDLVKQVKAYIKSVYGASSPQYRAANDIKFSWVFYCQRF
jgi:hypothetical protein